MTDGAVIMQAHLDYLKDRDAREEERKRQKEIELENYSTASFVVVFSAVFIGIFTFLIVNHVNYCHDRNIPIDVGAVVIFSIAIFAGLLFLSMTCCRVLVRPLS